MKRLIFALGLFFNAAIAHGQLLDLAPLGALQGAEILEFNLNSNGDILVYQKNAGLLFSDDKGQTWEKINSGFDPARSGIEILPNPNGNFYISTSSVSNEIYLFDIQDTSIDTIEIDSLGEYSDFLIGDNGALFIINDDKEIFSSTDEGTTWTLINTISGASTIRNILLGLSFSEQSIYVKQDFGFGNEDEIVEVSLDGSSVDTLSFIKSNITSVIELQSDTLLIGTSEGLFWYDKNSGTSSLIGDSEWYVYQILKPSTNGIIFIRTDEGYFAIDRLGGNILQSQIDIPNFNYTSVGRIAFDQNSNTFFIFNYNALNSNFFKSTPDFSNVQSVFPSLEPLRIASILKVDSNTIVVSKNFAVNKRSDCFISTDAGNSFSPLLIDGKAIFDLELGGNGALYAIAQDEIIYRSVDKGASWQDIQPPLMPSDGLSFDYLKAGDGDYIYGHGHVLGSDNRSLDVFFYSNDSGNTWQDITDGLSVDFNSKYGTTFDPHGNLYTNEAFSGDIWKYSPTDGSWEVLFDNSWFVFWLRAKDSLNILSYVLNRNGVFSVNTNDAFQTPIFNAVDLPDLPELIRNQFLVSIIFPGDEVSLSQNDGLTWEPIVIRDTITNPNVITSFFVDDENYLYVGFDGDELHRSTTPIQINTNSIIGKVQIDENDNCINDPSETAFTNVIVTAEGQDTLHASTKADGSYEIFVPDGSYDVYVNLDTTLWEPCLPIQTVSLAGPFDSTFVDFSIDPEIECPKLEVDLTTPFLRRCFENTSYVSYKNMGTIAADTPYVKITLDPRFDITSATIPFMVLNDSCYRFSLDTLNVFGQGSFSFKTEMECDSVTLGETVCMEAHIFPDSICGDPSPNWSGASLAASAECNGDSLIFFVKNIGTEDMVEARDYIIIEDVVIMRVVPTGNIPSGDSIRVPIEAMGQTFHFAVSQVENHPGQSFPSVTVENCNSTSSTFGLYNQFPQDDNNRFIDIECREVRGSYDPNDKSAVPAGIDVEHKIQPNSTIEYLIRFQNTGTDIAFTINIIDTLSNLLDLSSFQPGSSSHDYEYEIYGDGIVRFSFNNIMLPDSNANLAASNGFVKYKIAMKPDAPLGATILNDADIYFDFNDPIYTNETFHLIDIPWVTVKTEETFVENVEVNVFPNPFVEQATFDLKNAPFGEKQFRLFSLSGNEIHSQTFDNQQFVFNRGHLPKGVYVYQISKGAMKIAAGKLVIQ